MRVAVLLALVAMLLAAPAARAGGDFVDLAVAAGRIWLVGPAGAGGVWALLGFRHGARVALFALDGRLRRILPITEAGRMAADESGCWVSTGSWLLQITPDGRVRRVARAPLGDVATGADAVWLPAERSVLRVDERTGRLRRLATGHLRLGGYQHDLAAGNGALWALRHSYGDR